MDECISEVWSDEGLAGSEGSNTHLGILTRRTRFTEKQLRVS